MKWILVSILVCTSTWASATANRSGKCAKEAADAVIEAYGEAIADGNHVAVLSSKVSRNPAVYKVLVALMDGGGDPFAVGLDVTFSNPRNCSGAIVTYSK